jgi:hypothetical protein
MSDDHKTKAELIRELRALRASSLAAEGYQAAVSASAAADDDADRYRV